jgi:hypothetical protein
MARLRQALLVPILVLALGTAGCSKETPSSSPQPASAAPAATVPAAAPVAAPAAPASAAPASTAPAGATAASAAPPGPPTADALKSEDTNVAGVAAEVTECVRKEGVLSVKLRFRNTTKEEKKLALLDARDYEKYYVTAGSKKYFILKDSEGTYLTPQANGFGTLSVNLESGGQYTWWAKYPAPPADVKAVTLFTPVAPPLEDIPITDR